MRTSIFIMTSLLSLAAGAQSPAPSSAPQTVDPSRQPLPEQSLTRPRPGVDNSAYPLSDQNLSQPATATQPSVDTSAAPPVSGVVQIAPRVSSGPDNSKPWPTRTADNALTQKIRKNLLNHDANFAKTVKVETRNGVVTVSGQVVNAAQKRAVEKIVRSAAGEASVKNELTVVR